MIKEKQLQYGLAFILIVLIIITVISKSQKPKSVLESPYLSNSTIVEESRLCTWGRMDTYITYENDDITKPTGVYCYVR